MKTVQEFIDNLDKKWQHLSCRQLLALQQDVDSAIEGAIKWQNPYFSYNGHALLKWYCANDWINVYFFKGAQLQDPAHLFEETDNKSMRTIKLFADSELNEDAYWELVKSAVDLP